MKILAIVLQTQRIRESDLLLNILTEDRGRLSCLARGALKSKMRFPGGIDLWDSGYFELEDKKPGGIPVLGSISERERWPKLREDLRRFTFAAYVSEMILRLTEEDHAEDGALCRPLLKTLKFLSSLDGGHEQAAVCIFSAVSILRNLGYDPTENQQELSTMPEVLDWFVAMLEQEQPIAPFDVKLLEAGFNLLSGYSEAILGRELRSKQSAHDTVHRLVRSAPAAA